MSSRFLHLLQGGRAAARGGRAVLLVCVGALLGCARAGGGPEASGDPERTEAAMPATLASSLRAENAGDSVHFTLLITNASAAPVELTFSSGQSFDFVVEDGRRELWRWSAERMFTQAIRQETLAPGETRRYEASWAPPPGVRGELTVRGILTAREHPLEQRTAFRLP